MLVLQSAGSFPGEYEVENIEYNGSLIHTLIHTILEDGSYQDLEIYKYSAEKVYLV